MEYENPKRGTKSGKYLEEKEITPGQAVRKRLKEKMAHGLALEGEARTLGRGVWHSTGNRGRKLQSRELVLGQLIDLFSRTPVKE